ncbi:MAG TPA: hypothetical protein VFW24_15785 [Acidimicrobiales bacterium]|nr:hypothetical protein [Acidimicrobiales bacterium]
MEVQALIEHRGGDPVEVRNRFEGTWSSGFRVADSAEIDGQAAYQLRRGDGTVVPGWFSTDELRPSWEAVVEWQLPEEQTRPGAVAAASAEGWEGLG